MKSVHRHLPRGLLLAAAGILASGSAAGVPRPVSLQAFDAAVTQLTERCPRIASTECVDLAWRTADLDGDGELSVPELEAVRQQVDEWTAWKRPALPGHTATAISNGTRLAAAVGFAPLVSAFDADANGRLTQGEAFTDIALDERPLGDVLSDPQAVDRQALVRRIGRVSPVLGALLAGVSH